MAELVFYHSGRAHLCLPIERDSISLGRGTKNDVVIPDEDLPEHEALIEHLESGWWLINRSGRGTLLDSANVKTRAPLTDGATIHLGNRWTALFRLGDPTCPAETRARALRGGSTKASAIGQIARKPIAISWESENKTRQMLPRPMETISIGADPDNSILLKDSYASAFHARIFCQEGSWRLVDLQSTNGTYIDDIRIAEAVLEPGTRISIGETDLLVIDAGKKRGSSSKKYAFGMVTNDPPLKEILKQIHTIGNTNATVTVFGESGTGKELIARAIHDSSPRNNKPFIPVNCAAISKDLMESELFGHEKGAFTGAATARKGAFEEADGGTLFLDEVGELPPDLQASLLRAIELKEIRRVGASKPITVDIRIVTATNRDLQLEVHADRFREDLFYRLYVLPITLPPLRQRKGDIILLAKHFLETRSPGKPPVLTREAQKKMTSHGWPGNVRELKNIIERALLLQNTKQIDAEHIIFPGSSCRNITDSLIDTSGKTLAEIEREALQIALNTHQGNRRTMAKALGIARSTLQTKIKDLGLCEPNEQ